MGKLFGVPSVWINSDLRAEHALHSRLLLVLALSAADQSFFLDDLFRINELGELGEDEIVVVDVHGTGHQASSETSNGWLRLLGCGSDRSEN